MAKHSLIPASAPTSPAVTRSKQDRHPVTPQRAIHSAHIRQFTSPFTPATNLSTPYTPLSLRSFSSSNGSTLVTPASAVGRRRLSLSLSPEVNLNNKSLADIAENWRARANENGIKVSSGEEPSYEVDDQDLSNISLSAIDKALLPAPFLSNQRRARALSHVQAPLSQVPDPAQFGTPNRPTRPPGILNTPPPQPGYRLRGSVTDPPHTRRRPVFDQTSELFDIDEDEYAPYPPAFSASAASQSLPLALNDPFQTSNLSIMSEPNQFYETQSYMIPPLQEVASASACSICGMMKGSLAILKPCEHPLCSACLTSALNIVGEKDMECAMCKAKVEDFQLRKVDTPVSGGHASKGFESNLQGILEEYCEGEEDFDSGIGLLPSAIGGGNMVNMGEFDIDFMDRAQGASTPVAGIRAGRQGDSKPNDRVVLRIDNVPWDITPPGITAWLKYPVERVHVLLDRKGKTLSHAYAEMVNEDAAKAALRCSQNSVLGRGKRARGVTVTRSSQEELMQALFPSWQGNFDGSRPSLAGLNNEHVISTLQRGLLSETELTSLLHLIRSPDSHFLKVPSLPFYSLISILSKFPADDDSRVFWSGTLRDLLYEVTYAAVQVLLIRIEENPLTDWATLLTQIVRAALDCQAFTSEQMGKLSDILEAALPQSTSSPVGVYSNSNSPIPSPTRAQPHAMHSDRIVNMERDAFDHLAKEFGLEAHLVEALAQRLAGIC